VPERAPALSMVVSTRAPRSARALSAPRVAPRTRGRICRWEFYFAYCEAAFDARYLQDYQMVWQRIAEPHAQPALPARLEAVSSQRQLPAQQQGVDATTDAPGALTLPRLSPAAITAALFALYCLLAGVVIARQPRMLLALLSFAGGQATLKVRLWPPWRRRGTSAATLAASRHLRGNPGSVAAPPRPPWQRRGTSAHHAPAEPLACAGMAVSLASAAARL
jgi:hypothetical protein